MYGLFAILLLSYSKISPDFPFQALHTILVGQNATEITPLMNEICPSLLYMLPLFSFNCTGGMEFLGTYVELRCKN